MSASETCSCPLCGEFEGTPASVEAHISGSRDADHAGRLGEHLRDQIRSEADTGDSASVDGLDASASATDLSPRMMLLAGTLLFAVVVAWYAVGDSEEQPEEQEDAAAQGVPA